MTRHNSSTGVLQLPPTARSKIPTANDELANDRRVKMFKGYMASIRLRNMFHESICLCVDSSLTWGRGLQYETVSRRRKGMIVYILLCDNQAWQQRDITVCLTFCKSGES